MISPKTKRQDEALREYVARLRRRFPDRIDRILLFGSRARGDAGADSDTDVLVILREPDRELADAVTDQAFDIMVEYSVDIEPTIFDRHEWERVTHPPTSFAYCVLQESVPL